MLLLLVAVFVKCPSVCCCRCPSYLQSQWQVLLVYSGRRHQRCHIS